MPSVPDPEDLLSGNRLNLSLLAVGPSSPAPAEPFRTVDERGEFAAFLRAQPIAFAEVVEFRAGSVRGQHVHNDATEILYVVRGCLIGAFEDRTDGSRVNIDLPAGSRLEIAPGVGHAFRATEPTWVVSMANDADPLTDREAFPGLF